jgi:Na+-transporting methylmalonyl-CoA/oxaloacetate decarboxylase gamma subunit
MFNVKALLETLPYMLKGMAGIFIVTCLIILCVYVLGKLPGSKEN